MWGALVVRLSNVVMLVLASTATWAIQRRARRRAAVQVPSS
jgi:hypothetical protein